MEKRRGFEHISDILPRILRQVPTACDNLPNPPFDSPIETVFAESCFKFLSPTANVGKQIEVSTTHGKFRLDFLVSVNDRTIAVECDGKDFHEGLHDELRDAILLGEGYCDTVYHFRGCDLVYYPYDCIWLMSVLDDGLFTQRGHLQLGKLRFLALNISKEDIETKESFVLNIDPPARFLWVFRRSVYLTLKNPSLKYHWKVLYEFACKYPHASLDKLFNLRVSSWTQPQDDISELH